MPHGWEWFRFAAGVVVAPGMANGIVWWASWLTPLTMAVALVVLVAVVIFALVHEQRAAGQRTVLQQRRRERANLAFGRGMALGGVGALLASLLGVPWLESAHMACVVIAGGGAGLATGARVRLGRLETAT
ncbi:hypothetical protein [Ruania rhizosphaerae]|uniref:hypothetical protein n=1 Tax=Ruania rhizosphaerae TaxID=1840413 RepID=UPI0013574728|nr:hypothetical protein [Ruania rhizosphaerae]